MYKWYFSCQLGDYIYIYHQSHLKKGTRNNHWYRYRMYFRLIPWVWLTVYPPGWAWKFQQCRTAGLRGVGPKHPNRGPGFGSRRDECNVYLPTYTWKTQQKIHEIHVGKYTVVPSHGYICHGCHYFFVYVQPLNDDEVCFKQPWIESQLGRCWVNKTWSPILGCSGLLLTGQSRFEVGEIWFELITPVFDTYDVYKYLLNI